MKKVYCEQCDVEMNKVDDTKYICPICWSWGYFDKNDPEKFWFELVELEDEEDDNDIPEGCRACGGDYPNCTSSCNLMSD